MSNTRTYEELKQKLDAMAEEMHGKKSEPNAAAKKQIAAYNSAFWETMHTGMPRNELKVGSDGAGGYLVPETYDNRLVMALEEENVIRKLGATFQTTHKLHIPVSEGIDGAVRVKEGENLTPSVRQSSARWSLTPTSSAHRSSLLMKCWRTAV